LVWINRLRLIKSVSCLKIAHKKTSHRLVFLWEKALCPSAHTLIQINA
jgi:hypothetical protein